MIGVVEIGPVFERTGQSGGEISGGGILSGTSTAAGDGLASVTLSTIAGSVAFAVRPEFDRRQLSD